MKYRITPADPLISRDARPFTAGGVMHSLSWPTLPSISGAVRTALWKLCDDRNSPETLDSLRRVSVKGGFPVLRDKMYFPRPLDFLTGRGKVYQVRPLERFPEGSGADMPLSGLLPCAPDFSEDDDDFKPDKLKAFWSRKLMMNWLAHGNAAGFTLNDSETLSAPAQDERTHAKINPESGTSGTYTGEGRLFSTTGLDFVNKDSGLSQEQISIDITIPDSTLPELPEKFTAPLGGERRLAEFTRTPEDDSLWSWPSGSPEVYRTGDNFRVILASPALFADGWLPGWLSRETLIGDFPNTREEVRLISAVVDRWLPVSGWSCDRRRPGHKPMRRAVPAGSVYFFRVVSGELRESDLLLNSVCDSQQDNFDGFGMILTGRW